jgi:hypothetical protein
MHMRATLPACASLGPTFGYTRAAALPCFLTSTLAPRAWILCCIRYCLAPASIVLHAPTCRRFWPTPYAVHRGEKKMKKLCHADVIMVHIKWEEGEEK